jgi:hypothetical protein
MKIYTRVEQVAPRQLALTNGNMTPASQDMEEKEILKASSGYILLLPSLFSPPISLIPHTCI